MSLFQELKRRNVFRMAGLYVVVAWLFTQVAGTVLPMFGAPEWIGRSIVLLLVIGFVPTLLFSWIYELTPEGLRRESEVDRSESITSLTGRRIDRSITVVLVLALGYFAVDKFVLAPARNAREIASAIGQAAVASTTRTAESPARATSTSATAEGNAASSFRTGDELHICIDVDVPRQATAPVVGINITSAAGLRVATASSAFEQVRLPPLSGRARVQCIIPNIPFVQGNYSIRLGLESGNSTSTRLDDAIVFEVRPNDRSGRGSVPTAGHGCVDLESHWAVLPI